MAKELSLEYKGKSNPKIILEDWEFCSPFKCPFNMEILNMQSELKLIREQMEMMKKYLKKG